MRSLTLNDDWCEAYKETDTESLREAGLAWCSCIEQMPDLESLTQLNAVVEPHRSFLRVVQPLLRKGDLRAFVKRKGFISETLGFSSASETMAISTLLKYGADTMRTIMLDNLANMHIESAAALMKELWDCQNRVWDIYATNKTPAMYSSALRVSLISGLSGAPITSLPHQEPAVWYWIGRSLIQTEAWSNVDISKVKAAIQAIEDLPEETSLDLLVPVMLFVEQKKWAMTGLEALAGYTDRGTNMSTLGAMQILLPKSCLNWTAAEGIGLSFEDTVQHARAELSAATYPPVVLPGNLSL